MKEYNGFSSNESARVGKIQLEAIRSGKFPKPTRCDWQAIYDGANIQVAAKFYKGTSTGGTTPNTTLSDALPKVTAPDHTRLQTFSGMSLGIDTSTWTGPYVASHPPAYTTSIWNGTQETSATNSQDGW